MMRMLMEDSDNVVGKRITLEVKDFDSSIENLLNCIKDLASYGHSFDVVVDPGDDNESTFFIDGDGSDRIVDIMCENIYEENEDD